MLRQYKQKIKSLSLSPFADGRYEIFVNGQRLHSKLETGQFPDEAAMVAEIGKHA